MFHIDESARTIQPDLDGKAFQAFVLASKLFWTDDLYQHVAQEAASLGSDDPEVLEETLSRESPAYRQFAWLEHYLQQFKYYGRHGLLVQSEGLDDEVAAWLADAEGQHPERLRIAPDFTLPDYYTGIDFHQHPGGVWSDHVDAFVYEMGASTTTPTVSQHGDLHVRYARYVRELCSPKSILDLGCGFGKTTLPMKTLNPDADVVGIDLSAPCLKLAHLRALQARQDITFQQMACESLALDSESFDAITGSMLIHEMPQDAVRDAFAEAFRVLRPGGWLVLLDFYRIPGDGIGKFFHLGHSRRNEEPFMRTLLTMDLEAELKGCGFAETRFELFEEADGALANGENLPRSWRFPWTIVAAHKEVNA